MTVVRLHIDADGASWAMVRCDRCQATQKYPADVAARTLVTCGCGQSLDVRNDVDADVQVRTHPNPELGRERADARP